MGSTFWAAAMASVAPAVEDGVSEIAMESEPVTDQPKANTEAEEAEEGENGEEGAGGDEDGEADAEDSDGESEEEEEGGCCSCCNKPLIGSCTLCCFLGAVCGFVCAVLASGKKGKRGSRAMKARKARRGRRR